MRIFLLFSIFMSLGSYSKTPATKINLTYLDLVVLGLNAGQTDPTDPGLSSVTYEAKYPNTVLVKVYLKGKLPKGDRERHIEDYKLDVVDWANIYKIKGLKAEIVYLKEKPHKGREYH